MLLSKEEDQQARAAVGSLHDHDPASAVGELSRFRHEFYACLASRADALFELTDAVLCADGPVGSLVELSLVGEHRRGHGSLYAALARGRLDIGRLRGALSAGSVARAGGWGVGVGGGGCPLVGGPGPPP